MTTANIATRQKTKVFISYKRDVDPDQSLASQILNDLKERGHEVFIDRTMKAGQLWAKEIETQIKNCDFFIPLITEASSSSEMVKAEVEMARSHAEQNGGKPLILPVRLDFSGTLPYPLNAWLAPIQYAFWKNEEDTVRLMEELASAIEGIPLLAPMTEAAPDIKGGPPPYSASLPAPGGGLDGDDPWYIARSTDASATKPMLQRGVTVVIMGPRQMGKTSLLVRTLETAIGAGKRCILIDFQMLGRESMNSSTGFFQNFAKLLAEGLDQLIDIEDFWDPSKSPAQNLTWYVEKHILQAISESIVLAIDEADVLFQAEFMFDFFGMLRSWHNSRASPLKKSWKRLDIVLVTSTEPYLFIDRINESPFNIGEVLRLRDFTEEQVHEMNERHQRPLLADEVHRLHKLLNGQPYLTRKAFYVLNSGTSAELLFSEAGDSRGPFGDHLRYYLLRLANHPELRSALKQVANGHECTDESTIYRLESAGLVRLELEKAVPRCQLYAEYFRNHL